MRLWAAGTIGNARGSRLLLQPGLSGLYLFFLRFRTVSLCNIQHSAYNEEKTIISTRIFSIYLKELAATYVELLKLIFLGRAVHAILCDFPIYSRWLLRNNNIKKCNSIKPGHCTGWRSCGLSLRTSFCTIKPQVGRGSLRKMHSKASNRCNFSPQNQDEFQEKQLNWEVQHEPWPSSACNWNSLRFPYLFKMTSEKQYNQEMQHNQTGTLHRVALLWSFFVRMFLYDQTTGRTGKPSEDAQQCQQWV